MTTIAEMYRADRAAQSGSRIYEDRPAAPPASAPYERASYGGLSDYQNPRQPVEDKRSVEAQRRASEVSAWGIAAQRMAEPVTDEAWATHKAVMDGVGTGRGLVSHADRAVYQEQLAASRFGRVVANGDLAGAESSPGQPVPSRVYAAQVRQQDQLARMAALRSSGTGWQ